MPASFRDRPELPEELQLVWEAFGLLSEGRLYGPADEPLPIGFPAIDAWARRFGVDDVDEFEDALFLLRRLDAAYRERLAQR